MRIAWGRAASAFLVALLIFWLAPASLWTAPKEKILRIDMGEMDVVWPSTDLVIKGTFKFENGWMKREFPDSYEKGIEIELRCKGKILAEGKLRGQTDEKAPFEIRIDAKKAMELKDQIKELAAGQFTIGLKDAGEVIILYEGE